MATKKTSKKVKTAKTANTLKTPDQTAISFSGMAAKVKETKIYTTVKSTLIAFNEPVTDRQSKMMLWASMVMLIPSFIALVVGIVKPGSLDIRIPVFIILLGAILLVMSLTARNPTFRKVLNWISIAAILVTLLWSIFTAIAGYDYEIPLSLLVASIVVMIALAVSRRKIAATVLTDFIFLIALSFTVVILQFVAMDHVTKIMEIGGEMTGGLTNIYNQTESVSTGLIDFQNNEEVNYHLAQVVKYLLIMLLLVYILWATLQGTAWFFGRRLTSKRETQGFLHHIRSFAIQTIPFYLIYVLLVAALVGLIMKQATTMFPVVSLNALNIGFLVLALITAYYCFICYAVGGERPLRSIKRAFVEGTSRFPKFAPSILLMIVLFVVIDLVLRLSFLAESPARLVAIGLILLLPAITFSRLLMLKTWQESGKK